MKKLSKELKEYEDLINKVKKEAEEYERLSREKNVKWLELYRERQSICSHKYADGTSAWKHNYVYSNCEICGYDDL